MTSPISAGSCTRHPIRMVGRRVRVLQTGRGLPHEGEIGELVCVSGPLAPLHDGLRSSICVHVAEDSCFSVRFADGEEWTGYGPFDLEFANQAEEMVHLAWRHRSTGMFGSWYTPVEEISTACMPKWGYKPRRTLRLDLVTCADCVAIVEELKLPGFGSEWTRLERSYR